ncbi:hypothetical protein DFH08DRAFT_971146 [Mycena albidolilacea]|uniref:Uncharacterized protein n=1 Tax=Mycena albidolilacea TaxID=1033008 RepID=A0AAD7EEZ1_9AGAR|nr:hypothetical protein DFH08DRAFT_971146 [Mycena albidolilacea]
MSIRDVVSFKSPPSRQIYPQTSSLTRNCLWAPGPLTAPLPPWLTNLAPMTIDVTLKREPGSSRAPWDDNKNRRRQRQHGVQEHPSVEQHLPRDRPRRHTSKGRRCASIFGRRAGTVESSPLLPEGGAQLDDHEDDRSNMSSSTMTSSRTPRRSANSARTPPNGAESLRSSRLHLRHSTSDTTPHNSLPEYYLLIWHLNHLMATLE